MRTQNGRALAAIPTLRDVDSIKRPELIMAILRDARPVVDRYTENGEPATDWHALETVGRR